MPDQEESTKPEQLQEECHEAIDKARELVAVLDAVVHYEKSIIEDIHPTKAKSAIRP